MEFECIVIALIYLERIQQVTKKIFGSVPETGDISSSPA
jgi:hypothetical protein